MSDVYFDQLIVNAVVSRSVTLSESFQ